MPDFDAHRSYALGNRGSLLHIAVIIASFDTRRSYAVGNRGSLFPIAVRSRRSY